MDRILRNKIESSQCLSSQLVIRSPYINPAFKIKLDISEADKDSTKTDYYFGTVDYNRVNMMVGRDFVLEKYDNGPINYFIYPLLEINNKKSTAFNKTFSYKNL